MFRCNLLVLALGVVTFLQSLSSTFLKHSVADLFIPSAVFLIFSVLFNRVLNSLALLLWREVLNREGRDWFIREEIFINCVFKKILSLNQIARWEGIGWKGIGLGLDQIIIYVHVPRTK